MKSSYLLDGMADVMKANNINFVKNQMGGMFGFFFSKNMPRNFDDVVSTNDNIFNNFLNACIGQGIYFAPSKYEAGFMSTEHDEEILKNVLDKIKKIIEEGL
jgi:glutamate-1-semialdehyde 2,1-aminomutase